MSTKKSLTFVCISDTHTMHHMVELPKGDVLIFAGDCCSSGNASEFSLFSEWFKKQPFKHKIFVAGNHDKCLDPKWNPSAETLIEEHTKDGSYHFLNGSGCEIDGIKIWGSPISPMFGCWAFNRTDDERKELWGQIPSDTEVLITHTPSYGILDSFPDNTMYGVMLRVGCKQLKSRIRDLKNLRVHVCGHIHYSNSRKDFKVENRILTCINASICTERYRPEQQPHTFILPKKTLVFSNT